MVKGWTRNTKPAALSPSDKTRLEAVVSSYLSATSPLAEVVHRVEIKAGRIYLYRLHEQFGWDKPDVQFIKPLINGKYVEFPMARITLHDKYGDTSEVAYQRHTGQWMSLFKGNINECLTFVEDNEHMFQ